MARPVLRSTTAEDGHVIRSATAEGGRSLYRCFVSCEVTDLIDVRDSRR